MPDHAGCEGARTAANAFLLAWVGRRSANVRLVRPRNGEDRPNNRNGVARCTKSVARGDIGFLKWEIDELLLLFRISLDPKCSSYRELGQAVLKAFVRALHDTARRQKGEPV